MEAKVDVRKLQLLNDRITQTIDALNQVRLSVHGLGHTPYGQGGQQYNPYQQPYTPYPQAPWMTQPGLGHSGVQQQNPWQWQQYQPQNPYPFGQQYQQQMSPEMAGQSGGLQHSPFDLREQQVLEQRSSDPLRISQTFPNVFSPIGMTW